MENIKIVVLCGGKGERLKPITEEIPKSLIEIEGKAILDHALELYSKKGFNDFILCIGYKGELIKNHFKNNKKYNLQFVDSGENASMLKRIYDTKNLFRDSTIIAYGDTYADIDFKSLLKFHKSKSSLLTIVTTPIKSPFGITDIDEIGKVTSFKEKPVLSYYIGYFVIDKKAFDYMKEYINLGSEESLISFFNILIKMNKIYTYSYSGLHITFNTSSEKKIADNIFKYFTYGENHNNEK